MNTYHKIQLLFKRDYTTPDNKIIVGKYSLDEFDFLKNCTWQFDEKIDGMNMRLMWKDEKLTYNGKTDRANLPGNLVKTLNDMAPELSQKLEITFGPTDVCLYGEGYGAGIQKGCGYSEQQKFILFDILVGGTDKNDITANQRWWLKRPDVIEIASKLGLDMVPSMGFGTLADLVHRVEKGFNSNFGDFTAEGIVARPLVDLFARNGRRIITKLRCRDFEGLNDE